MAIEHAACWPSTRRQLPGGSAPSRAVSGTFADQRSAMLPAIDRASAGHAPRTTSARCDARVVPGTTPAKAIAPAAPNARNHAHEEPSHGKARPPRRGPRARRGPRQPTATTEAPAVKHHLCALMMPPTVSRPMSPHSVKRPVDRVRSDTHQERIATPRESARSTNRGCRPRQDAQQTTSHRRHDARLLVPHGIQQRNAPSSRLVVGAD